MLTTSRPRGPQSLTTRFEWEFFPPSGPAVGPITLRAGPEASRESIRAEMIGAIATTLARHRLDVRIAGAALACFVADWDRAVAAGWA